MDSKNIYAERCIRVFAGSFVIISVALFFFVKKWLLLIAAFVGVNLFQFGFSDACPMEVALVFVGITVHCDLPQKIPSDASTFDKFMARMTVTKWIRVFAGAFIMVSVIITYLVSDWAVLLALFVGVNLFQFGFTNLCPLATILRYLGVRDSEKKTLSDVAVVPSEDKCSIGTEMV